MSFRSYSLIASLLSTVLTGQAHAQSDIGTVQVTADSKTYTSTFSASDSHIKKVIYWFNSPGNSSQGLDMYVEAPPNTKFQLKSALKGGEDINSLAQKEAKWNILSLLGASGQEKKGFTFGNPQTASALSHQTAAASVDCTTLSEAEIQHLLDLFLEDFGIPETREQLCGKADTGSGGGTGVNATDPQNSASNFSSIFSKDGCVKKSGSAYLVGAEFDITNIDPALFAKGFTIKFAVENRIYKGETASSIKPISEGQYAPRPLILMSSLGSFGSGEQIRVVTWSRGKIKRVKKIKVVKYVFYNGLALATGLLDGILTGGKGTFELASGANVYSACFALKRTRQRANGYHN